MHIVGLALIFLMASVAKASVAKAYDTEDIDAAKEDSLSLIKNREKFLFGSYSTTTYTAVTASTSTVFFSCLSGTQSQSVCEGRRGGRRAKKLRKPEFFMKGYQSELNDDLESSQGEPIVSAQEDDTGVSDPAKIAFTIWTTSRTTTSVTVIYTNTSTTIRLSYLCIVGGMSVPQFRCQG